MMNDTQFHQLADQLMQRIEMAIDNFTGQSDVDCEIQGNVMTLTFENNDKIIINRQEALHQIWLATKTGGYHFNYAHGNWYCDRTNKEFTEILTEAFTQATTETISF